MEDTSPVLVIIAAMARWGVAIVAALVVFLLYRWAMGPEMGFFGLLVGCALFTAVALAVRRVQGANRSV